MESPITLIRIWSDRGGSPNRRRAGFGVSNTASGVATEYNTAGVGVTAASNPSSANSKLKSGLPSGQVWSGYGTDFLRLRRASRQTLSSPHWTARFPATTGVPLRSWSTTAPMAVYTGLGIGVSELGPTLYAANFGNGSIDTFDKKFKPAPLAGGFIDPNLPAGYAPTSIQRFGQRMYVTYGQPNGHGGFIGGPVRGRSMRSTWTETWCNGWFFRATAI
jgi:hypothetical protein